jgi:hypothetical protein
MGIYIGPIGTVTPHGHNFSTRKHLENGLKSGTGKIYYNTGSSYAGEFKNDIKEGYGVFRWSDGSTYEGEYKNDRMNGFGKLKKHHGVSYEGNFENDKRHGFGKQLNKDVRVILVLIQTIK